MKNPLLALLACVTLLVFPCANYAQQPASPAQEKPQPAPPPQNSAPQQQPAQEGPTSRGVFNWVDFLATFLDRRNKLVSDLDKNDFKIFDDNIPQEIRFFSKQSDLPLRIGMLLDTSNSIRDRLKFEQEAAVDFLYSVLRRGKDQAFAMTFDDEPQIIQAFTADGGSLRDQINHTRARGPHAASET